MINKKKIFNDPVYGFISIPYDIVYDLIEHPYFQRLRRIKQLGFTDYVYPCANHTRFSHVIGAVHLISLTIKVLRSKGIRITEEEAEGVTIAILLHDIGHGPFSHALEHTIVNVHHEELSLLYMEYFNEVFDGRLSLAMQIFKNTYKKPFLHQLVSGQLDLDRMDYLNRDSFFTGVYEGVIGYDRIIKMLSVKNEELVVEEKGIYSIEKFLIARRLMYWQVYLHKTVLSAEQMLVRCLKRAKLLASQGIDFDVSEALRYFLYNKLPYKNSSTQKNQLLAKFAELDDYDVVSAIKIFQYSDDKTLSYLAESLLYRKLFKCELKNRPFERDYIDNLRQKLEAVFAEKISEEFLVFEGNESNTAYIKNKDEIKILYKDGSVLPISEISEMGLQSKRILKYYLCYPKTIV